MSYDLHVGFKRKHLVKVKIYNEYRCDNSNHSCYRSLLISVKVFPLLLPVDKLTSLFVGVIQLSHLKQVERGAEHIGKQ